VLLSFRFVRASILTAILLFGCGSSTSAPPPGSNNTDGGTGFDSSTEPTCFGDGWCSELVVPGIAGYSVWASASNDVWTISAGRKVHHYDGTSWKTSEVPGEGAEIAVFGRAANDVWVSLESSVKHWDGTNWTTETVTPPTELSRFTIDEKGDVWARSYTGVYKREGTAWIAKLPDKTLEHLGHNIAACDSKVWIPNANLIEWDGTTFWQHGVSSNDEAVRAAGASTGGNVWFSGRFLDRLIDGAFKANLLEGAPKGLFSMSFASDTEAYALGEAVFASFNGTTWKVHPTIDAKGAFSVFPSTPGHVRVMGQNGSVFEYDLATGMRTVLGYSAGTTIVGPKPAVSWISATEAYYIENGSMWRWAEGSLYWSSRGTSDKEITKIWAENTTSVWMAGGKKFRHFTGGSTTVDVNTGITLDADESYLNVGGTGGGDVWAITNKRNLHFTGGAWKAYPSGFVDKDAVAFLVSLAANDAWVFRGQGRAAHFDGASFTVFADQSFTLAGCAPSKELLAISANPPRLHRGAPLALKPVADLAADYNPIGAWFGADGTAWILAFETTGTSKISYFDGKTVRVSASTPNTNTLQAIWALPSGEAWAVGTGGMLHRKAN
jgi:hypothetical protein